jgi:hypothetical protein
LNEEEAIGSVLVLDPSAHLCPKFSPRLPF